jgi:thioredoxin-like negative regulator of GroEL
MERRLFLSLAAGALMVPAMSGAETLGYREGLVQERLDAGEVVFVEFNTAWCTTCRAQERVIGGIKSGNPAYEQAITFVNVDWDVHSNGPLAERLGIPRRSTLVVLKGDQELGRIVAGTSQSQIQELMDIALAAAG